ncbi:hypothetical protein G6F70_000360 [Rhizopus microsporus]|nr:hypothetical protein G6F71_004137 [Rhizopus microsporus]KAG1204622.1 hypothetical protein G6F70_000360 [Rhizopus microsporus]KAG1212026.1 hypothetical protein G6F69_004088 [Rhizopus microsporus]KAG1235086.1 hypothetical protein G6F67_003050 [Rhizopus microsporus]KAG1264485.1 hypothetical protein G6F68_004317 [Rhizopus microsporus]
MDPSFPYYPPHTENAYDQSIKGNAGSSLLLTTDPKDLDKLFDRSIEAEQDICFPTKRPNSSSMSSTTTATFSPPPRKHNGHNSFQNNSINVNALSSWFTDIDMHSSMTQYYQPTKQTKKKLSLYGDNHHIVEDSKEDRYMYFHPDTGVIRGKSLLELKLPPHLTVEQLLLKENFWIDITSPSLAEMKAISKIFHIHPLTTEDIMAHEIHIDLYKFHFGHVPHTEHVLERVIQLQDYIEVVPDWINYAIMDEITDSFAPMIQQIESEVDTIDDLVLLYKTDQTDMVLRIGTCRKRVIQMVRLLGTKAEVVKALMKRIEERTVRSDSLEEEANDAEMGRIYPDVGLYLGDVQDHILTMLQNLNHYETVLARSESNYLARISIELTQTSNSTNHVIGRLTIFATILLPMNLITGLWGKFVKL